MSRSNPTYLALTAPMIPLILGIIIYTTDLQTDTFLALNYYAQFFPNWIWAWLTFLGNGWGIFAISFPLLILAPRLLSAGILSGAISGLVVLILKPLINLPRPAALLSGDDFYLIGEPLLQNAMPSGHTLTAFAIVSAYFFSIEASGRKPLYLLYLISSLVGVSRIAVGAHWLTDVLVGASLGIWCGMIGAFLSKYIPDSRLSPTDLWPRIISGIGIICLYMLLTTAIDFDINKPLQYGCALLITLTLIAFTKLQKFDRKS